MNSSKGKGKAVVVQKINEDGVVLFDPDNLPLGYIFRPKDIQLLLYLTKKIHHRPLPPNSIAQVNLYAHHPDQLAATYKAQGEKEWYYFTPRERKYTNGQRPKRSIEDGDGYWKATGAEQEIWEEDGSRKIIIGYKRALVFYQGNHLDGVKTNWIMHEFRLAAPTTNHRIVNKKRFDDYVICKVYKNNRSDGCSKRLRDDQSTSVDIASASKIPKLELNPAEANAQLTASPGIILQPAEEFTNYEHDPYVNIPQRLQNQQQQRQPIVQMAPPVSSAWAVFPDNKLPVLPQAGEDVFLHRHSERLWDNQWANNASSSSSKIPELKHSPDEAKNQLTVSTSGMDWVELKKYWISGYDVYNPVVNIPQRLENQHEQQHLQPTVQIPQVLSACTVFPENNNLPVLPPAGLDVSLHRLWDDRWTNDASSSNSKIPELKHGPDGEAQNQLTVSSSGMDWVEPYWAPDYVNIPQNLQNQREQQQQQKQQQPIVPNDNIQVLRYDQNDYTVQTWESMLPTTDSTTLTMPMPRDTSNTVQDNPFFLTPDPYNGPYL